MGEEGNSAFSAFVSYSHADKTAAQKLHRKLEGYRLPKHVAAQLAGRDQGNGGAADGKADGRLGQIFRDREDLPAAQDLSQSVKEALSVSGALVVLCSPAAKASPWVAREIQLFRELHPGRPVLAALIEGEPADAFPESLLQGGEPLAADLRKEGDGPRLGFLKVVAGIAGVPLDALVQRDAQRRLRRVTMITGGALAAMLAMAIMTFIAIQSRNEAQRQRAEAEGLVEYMLTDLRSELKGRTTIRVMSKVNKRALAYYEAQGDLNDLPDDSLGRWARLLHARGEDFEKQGKLDEALAKFTDAHRVTEALLEREPDNPDRIFEHAQSEYWVGYAAWQNRDLETTGKYWRGYLRQAKALSRVEPSTIRSLMELGYSNGNLCELTAGAGKDMSIAIKYCKSSIVYEARAVAKAPDNVSNSMALANRYGWMADALMKVGRYDDAMAQRKAEQVLIDGLVKNDPENGELLLRQTWPKIGRGAIEIQRAKPTAAILELEGALVQLELIAKKFPSDYHIVAVQIRSHTLLAKVKKKLGGGDWSNHQRTARALFEKAKAGADGEAVRRMASTLEI
ncbi:MAG: toll/interleukin-1 receptor domain-containing protein [Sphingorhabdus sp.]